MSRVFSILVWIHPLLKAFNPHAPALINVRVVGNTEDSRPTLALLAETTVPGLSVRLGLSKPRINQYPEQFVSFHILDQIHG